VEEQFEKVLSQSTDPNISFYKEYCRLYLNNVQLIDQVSLNETQVKSAQENNRQLELLVISSLKTYTNNSSGQNNANPEDRHRTEHKNTRLRRTAGEIARHYVCNYEKCQKSYGSEGSLNQHIKLKHSTGMSH
jgi:hypothetical protein